MKSLIGIITICLLAVQASAHPLEGAVMGLSKVSSDLLNARRGASPAEQTVIDRLSAQVEGLWSDAILMPLKVTDPMLARLGYEFEPSTLTLNYEAKLKKNDNAKELELQTYELDPALWHEVDRVVTLEMTQVADADRMTFGAQFNSGLSLNTKTATLRQFARTEGLKRLHDFASKELSCIGYFAANFPSKGLVPVDAGRGYAWSVDSLQLGEC